jgi:hypothetical protein
MSINLLNLVLMSFLSVFIALKVHFKAVVAHNVHRNVRLSSSSVSTAELTTSEAVSKNPRFKIPSSIHPAYTLKEQSDIEEYGLTALLLKHKKSGAEVLSVSANDENKGESSQFYSIFFSLEASHK